MRKWSRDQNFEKIKNSHHLIILKPFKTKGRFQNPFDRLSEQLTDHFLDPRTATPSKNAPVVQLSLSRSPGLNNTLVMHFSLCLGNGNRLYSKVNFHNYGHVNGHEFFGFFSDSVRIFFDWYSIWMFDCKLIMHV